jgi:Ca2+-binding EF-hand superfamily protein
MSNLSRLAVVLGAAALALPLAIPASAKGPGASKVISMVDTDNEGTIDLKEAQAVAGALFDKLESDKDGTVDAKELQGRVSKKALKAADPDSDGTLDKTEFLALVEARFKAADPDAGPRPTSRDGPALPAPGLSRFRAWESSRSNLRQGLTGGGSSEHSRLACHSHPAFADGCAVETKAGSWNFSPSSSSTA